MGKQKDHYVPQFYLRNFANNKKQVGVFDRGNQAWRTNLTNVKDVSAEKDFYTIRGAGDGARDVESLLSRIEGEASRVIHRIHESDFVLNANERNALSFYIVLQYLRTKSTRLALRETANGMDQMRAELTLRYSTDDQFRRQTRSALGYDPIAEEVETYKKSLHDLASGAISRDVTNTHIQTMLAISREVSPVYAQQPWTLLVASSRSIITSDHPVCLFNVGPTQSGLGLLTVDGVLFPLSSKSALLIDLNETEDALNMSTMAIEGRQALEINQAIASHCENQLYAHPQTKLPAKFPYPSKTKISGEINGSLYRRGESMWEVLRRDMLPAWDNYFARMSPAGSDRKGMLSPIE
jgi:hypothetical protein